jgi:hypothetical protein
MYMDRENYNQAKMSLNFFNFIVEPLFTSIKELLPKIEICLGNLFYNKKMWTMIEEENQKLKQEQGKKIASFITYYVDGNFAITAPPVVEKPKEPIIEEPMDEEPMPSPAKKSDDEPSMEYKKYQTKQSTKIAERINKTVVRAWTDNIVSLRPSTAASLSPTTTTLVAPIFPGKGGMPAAKNKKPPIAGGYYQSRKPASPRSTLKSVSAKPPPKSVLLSTLHDPSPKLYRNRTNTTESL